MDIEPEVARQQMEDTRASLTEKLGTLEQHVVDTVQGATSAVTDTVDNVKEAVADTMENVKDAMNLRLQVERHPWGVLLGSVAVGYLGGYLLHRLRSARPRMNDWSSPPASAEAVRFTTPQHDAVQGRRSLQEPLRMEPAPEVRPVPSAPGWLSGATHQFAPEISKLKGMVIGKALSSLRDVLTQSVSAQLKPEVAKVMDSITVKLGGEPTPGPGESSNR